MTTPLHGARQTVQSADETLLRDLEVSNFVQRATSIWERTGRITGVLLCSECRNPYAIEAWPERRTYRVIESKCTCATSRRDFIVIDQGDSDWARIKQCDDGIGHEFAWVDDGWKCVNCGGLAEEVV